MREGFDSEQENKLIIAPIQVHTLYDARHVMNTIYKDQLSLRCSQRCVTLNVV